jgi:hypothetical protein
MTNNTVFRIGVGYGYAFRIRCRIYSHIYNIQLSRSVRPYIRLYIHRGRIRFEFEMVFEWPIFGLFSNQIEYFIRTVIVYVYVDSPSQARRKLRDSAYALRTSKNIRFEFETIFECRKIRKTLKFSNFESNIFSNPTPIYTIYGNHVR